MKNVTVIGGGLSGLITSIQLIRAGVPVQLFEKKVYPFHRVCGEYISNETVPFLKSLGLFPSALNPATIRELQLTSVNGKSAFIRLDMGGFGISRYVFDNWLYEIALSEGVKIYTSTEITEIEYRENEFEITSLHNKLISDVVIGSFGKRSKIDVSLDRPFIKKRSPYIGIKYHLRYDHPDNLIALHNFKGGYCGISNVENGISNLCYLSHRSNLKEAGNIEKMEEQILSENPFLKDIFNNAEFLFDHPEVINEISFETKKPVENHILMSGDAAGMITPLCGNGMAMAIHSSKLLAELIIPFCRDQHASRDQLEFRYAAEWNKLFARRLWTGRQMQKFFGGTASSNVAVILASGAKPIANFLVSKTHGKAF